MFHRHPPAVVHLNAFDLMLGQASKIKLDLEQSAQHSSMALIINALIQFETSRLTDKNSVDSTDAEQVIHAYFTYHALYKHHLKESTLRTESRILDSLIESYAHVARQYIDEVVMINRDILRYALIGELYNDLVNNQRDALEDMRQCAETPDEYDDETCELESPFASTEERTEPLSTDSGYSESDEAVEEEDYNRPGLTSTRSSSASPVMFRAQPPQDENVIKPEAIRPTSPSNW